MTFEQFMAHFDRALINMEEKLIDLFPGFVAALLVLLVGILIARLVRFLARRLVLGLGKLVPEGRLGGKLRPEDLEKSGDAAGRVLYWIVVLAFATAATEIMGLPVVTTWLGGIASWLPRMLVFVLIIAAGIISASILHDIVKRAAKSAGLAYAGTLATLARTCVIAVSALIGIDQLGIDVTFLTTLVLITVGAALLAAALALGLGARPSVHNILASYYARKTFSPGQKIRLGETEGRIAEINPTGILMETKQGRVHIPAARFNETTTVILEEDR